MLWRLNTPTLKRFVAWGPQNLLEDIMSYDAVNALSGGHGRIKLWKTSSFAISSTSLHFCNQVTLQD